VIVRRESARLEDLQAFVEGKAQHTAFRRALAPALPRRILPVLRAWARGDYHRYGHGVWSAGVDVARAPWRPARRAAAAVRASSSRARQR
jgi:hypothetical protein